MSMQLKVIIERAERIRSEILTEVEHATMEELHFHPGSRWSVRDILIHLGNWEEVANTSTRQLLQGEDPDAFKITSWDAFNTRELARYQNLDLAGALDYLNETRAEAKRLAEAVTDEQVKEHPSIRLFFVWAPSHEATHLHQIREALARARGDHLATIINSLQYNRQRILNRFDYWPPEAFEWCPADGRWSIKAHMIHLAVWDRYWADFFAALREGKKYALPYSPGDRDTWNAYQVQERGHKPVAEVLYELGAARGALYQTLSDLTGEELAGEQVQTWAEDYRQHDFHHLMSMDTLERTWRKQMS